MIKLRYGNTNTFYIQGSRGGLLLDTGYAGSLHAFCRAIKEQNIRTKDISYVLATHYHPDHMGIIGELCTMGIKLLLTDTQKDYVHCSDYIFKRDGLTFLPVDETAATVITCKESRQFLSGLGISGELVSIPSHSPDSVCLMLDDGDCFAGDLEPFEYLQAYENNEALKKDWDLILSFDPKRIFCAHMPEKELKCQRY